MLVGSYGRGFRLLMLVKGWHQLLVTVLWEGIQVADVGERVASVVGNSVTLWASLPSVKMM